MAKRKVKNSVDNLAAAQPRLPKTRRRDCPTKTEETKTNFQDIAVDATLPKKSTVILAVEQQNMEHQSLVTEENAGDREVTDLSAGSKMATATEMGPTAFSNTCVEFQSEHLMAPINNDTSQDRDLEEVVVVVETSRSEPHSCIGPLHIHQGPLTAFEDQPHTNESSHREKIQETDQHNNSSDSTSDVKKATLESQVFPLPAKKKPLIDPGEEMSPEPSSEFLETGDAMQTEAGGSDRNDGTQAKVRGVVVTLERLSAVFGPAQEGQSCKDKDGVVDGPQESGDTRSDPRAEQEDQEPQQLDGDPVENLPKEPPQQMKGVEDADQSPSSGLNSTALKNQAPENRDATKATPPVASGDTNTAGETSSHLACDAGRRSSSAETSSGVCAVGPAAPSLGSEKKDTLDVDDGKDTRSSFLSPEPCRMKGSTEPFGSSYLGDVSDSQLNTIPLTEEEIVKGEKDLGSPDCPDGTDLICGLIKELSWLNRKVMATHRELENMRRSTKSLRSSTR